MARPQWCALPQASMATTQRGCSEKKLRTLSGASFLRNPSPPSNSGAMRLEELLSARSNRPITRTFLMDGPSRFVGCENITTRHIVMPSGGGIHSITVVGFGRRARGEPCEAQRPLAARPLALKPSACPLRLVSETEPTLNSCVSLRPRLRGRLLAAGFGLPNPPLGGRTARTAPSRLLLRILACEDLPQLVEGGGEPARHLAADPTVGASGSPSTVMCLLDRCLGLVGSARE